MFRRKVRIPKIYREDEEPLDVHDIRRILLSCNNRRLKAYLLVLASTGIRATEGLAIRLKEIDFTDNPTKRIMELNEQRRDLWEVVRKYENQPFVQIAAHKEIQALTKSILQIYEALPLILNNNNNDNNNRLSDLIFEDTTSLFPEVSVK